MMRFAILECTGSPSFCSSPIVPKRPYITRFMEPFLIKKGWKLVYFSYVESVATLVGLREEGDGGEDLDKSILSLTQYCKGEEGEYDRDEEVRYPSLYLGGIRVLTLMDSTDKDADIFAGYVQQKQFDRLLEKVKEFKEELKVLGKGFQNF